MLFFTAALIRDLGILPAVQSLLLVKAEFLRHNTSAFIARLLILKEVGSFDITWGGLRLVLPHWGTCIFENISLNTATSWRLHIIHFPPKVDKIQLALFKWFFAVYVVFNSKGTARRQLLANVTGEKIDQPLPRTDCCWDWRAEGWLRIIRILNKNYTYMLLSYQLSTYVLNNGIKLCIHLSVKSGKHIFKTGINMYLHGTDEDSRTQKG